MVKAGSTHVWELPPSGSPPHLRHVNLGSSQRAMAHQYGRNKAGHAYNCHPFLAQCNLREANSHTFMTNARDDWPGGKLLCRLLMRGNDMLKNPSSTRQSYAFLGRGLCSPLGSHSVPAQRGHDVWGLSLLSSNYELLVYPSPFRRPGSFTFLPGLCFSHPCLTLRWGKPK